MARKEFISSRSGVFALNETTVGKNGQNRRRSDIQLVQFFLHQFFLKNPDLFRKLPPTKKRNSVIVIDGEFGKQTAAGIVVFQQDAARRGIKVKPDGLVNVATGNKSAAGNNFTIMLMNFFFVEFGEGKEHHGNLQNHPLIFAHAPELAGELFTSLVRDDF